MKNLYVFMLTLILASPTSFAVPGFDLLHDLEKDYEDTLLVKPFMTRANQGIKDKKLFKKTISELLNVYAEELAKKNVDPFTLSTKLTTYQNHLFDIAIRQNTDLKKQISEEYQMVLKKRGGPNFTDLKTEDAHQIILASLFSKHYNSAQTLHLTQEEKNLHAALALRALTESYIIAANPGISNRQSEINNVNIAIYIQITVASLFSAALADGSMALDLFASDLARNLAMKVSLGLSLLSSTSAAVIYGFEDSKLTKNFLNSSIVNKHFKKLEAQRQTDLFWSHVQTRDKEGSKDLLSQHIASLLNTTQLTFSQLVKSYRALKIQQCKNNLSSLKFKKVAQPRPTP